MPAKLDFFLAHIPCDLYILPTVASAFVFHSVLLEHGFHHRTPRCGLDALLFSARFQSRPVQCNFLRRSYQGRLHHTSHEHSGFRDWEYLLPVHSFSIPNTGWVVEWH